MPYPHLDMNCRLEIQLSLTNRARQWRGSTHKRRPQPHMCYHAKFGSSSLKDVGINISEPQKLGSLRTLLS